jgi:DNA mismatch endonuclease (patch repair protein)
MAGIGGKDTKPELALRRALHARGFRYRIHDKRLPGRPDIVLPKYRAVIFVHGCFWHRHADCRYAATPKTRPELWVEKFRGNMERDARNLRALQDAGWRTAVLWECALDPAGLHDAAELVAGWLVGDGRVLEVGQASLMDLAWGGLES